MKRNFHNYAFTIVEMLLVISIVVMMLLVVTPAVPGMIRSHKMASAINQVRSALSLAQAYAAQHQKYAGIRFQQTNDGRQYLVMIVKDGYRASRYVAIPNAKPSPLSSGIGLISAEVDNPQSGGTRDNYLDNNAGVGDLECIEGARTFSIVFSPTGQLVVKYVEVQPERGHKIFGTQLATTRDTTDGFYRLLSHDYDQDTSAPWCAGELSTTGLYIYEQNEMDEVDPSLRYSEYIGQHGASDSVEQILINIYTGGIIDRDN